MTRITKILLAVIALSLPALALPPIIPGVAGSFIDEMIAKAEQGDADVQIQLGAMYLLGQGVPQDNAKAMSWYRKSAEQGNAYAQYDLGLMYSEGKSVRQNYVEAHKWFTLAVSNGVRMAGQFRKGIIPKMSPAQIAEAQRLAKDWKVKK